MTLVSMFIATLFAVNTMAQELMQLKEETVYHIRINGLYLADTGIEFDENTPPINEVFTGNACPTLQNPKTDSWSQLWYFENKGDSYNIISFNTDRHIWTNARVPQDGKTWKEASTVNEWSEMPPMEENLKLLMGPSAASVGLGGWNSFKIYENDRGKVTLGPVWNHEEFWKGGFMPENEIVGSKIIVFRPSDNYEWEIVEVCSFDDVPDDSGQGGTSIHKTTNDNFNYNIDGHTVSSNEHFEVFTLIGNSLGSFTSVSLDPGIYLLKSTDKTTTKIIIH